MKGRAEIHEFVQGLLTASGDDGPLADSDSLLFSGRLQSIDAVEIVVFLEENFGIDFAQVGFDKEQIDIDKAVVGFCGAASSIHYVSRWVEELLPAETRIASHDR